MVISRRDFLRGTGAATLGGITGCGSRAEADPSPLPKNTNVLLVILDTVGAESVSSFGHPTPLTPNIDRLAAEGVTFQQTYSTAPWTKPSISTMLTGLFPNRCGMSSVTARLDPAFTTLAAAFRKKGYHTAAAVSHFLLGGRFGMNQGFETYDETLAHSPKPHQTVSSPQLTDAALRWLDNRPAGPFFLMAHYFDPHYDFFHHAEFDRTAGYTGPLKPGMPIDELLNRRASLTPEDIGYLHNLYREEIAFTDSHLGRLIARLDALGLADETLVIVTADHGEEFMRHGWIGHTVSLYNELIHVPLLFRLPGRLKPGTCRAPVSLTDLWPTLAALFSLEKPAYPLDGRSLAPLLADPAGTGDAGRIIFSEVDYVPMLNRKVSDELITFKTALVMDGHKLIHDRRANTWGLYDLAADPNELTNLSGGRVAAEASFRRELAQWEAARKPIRVDTPDFLKPDEIEKLKSLGYLR